MHYLCPAFVVKQFGLVVQLVRMPPCHGGGRGFESRPVRKLFAKVLEPLLVTRTFFIGVVVLIYLGLLGLAFMFTPLRLDL